jgi:hypothetical protein
MLPHYKKIPTTPYINSGLNINAVDSIELFYKAKKNVENLYTGYIKTSLLYKYDLIHDITEYLRDRRFLQTFHPTEFYSTSEYLFPKCCWLADSIIKNGVVNPLSVHYNPRIQQHVSHPGQTRSYIAHLFQPDTVNCVYFNTNGVKFSWMKHFSILEKSQLLDLKLEHFKLGTDHGALIPQLFFGNRSETLTNIFEYHAFIKNRLSDMKFRIKSNVPIYPLEYWTTSDNTAPIEISIKNTRDPDDVVRACILSVLGKPYKSNTLEVKINTV